MSINSFDFVFVLERNEVSLNRFNLFNFIEEFKSIDIKLGVSYRCCILGVLSCNDLSYFDRDKKVVYDFIFEIHDRSGQDVVFEGMYRELFSHLYLCGFIFTEEGILYQNTLRFVVNKIE